MQIVTQEVSTDLASVSVIDSKKTTVRPGRVRNFAILRLHYIENDGYAVLVIIPTNSKRVKAKD